LNIVEPFAYGNSFVHCLDPRVKIITAALHYLYVPNKLVHIFFFSYRYIHVINLEYLRLTNAVKVRCFIPRNNLHTYKSFAYLIGMLILKSYERSRRIYNAMLCRGFKGKFYILERCEFYALDWFFGIK